MKLKNIQTRKDFLRIDEAYGDDGGFSNNLSLQNTYLGKLLNGMFKSISWLWRKSKENFIINKLIGRMTNELLRGVILYCFANDINIASDEVTSEEKAKEPEKESDEQTDEETKEKEELKMLGASKVLLQLPSATPETKKSLQASIEEQNAEEIRKHAIALFISASDDDKKRALANMNNEQIQKFLSYLPDEQKQKYLPKNEPKALTSGTVSTSEPVEFESIRKDITEDLKNPSPDLMKKIFGVKFNKNSVKSIKNLEEYEKIINDMKSYLSKNISNYDKMKDPAKEKIRNIYMNYIISKDILNSVKSEKVSESLVAEKLVKAPMSDPRAGADPKAKTIKTKVKVKQILTKRDREKYKEHQDEMDMNISKINLAGIEKEIEKRGSQSEVSKFVNPENLKTVQMVADKMILPERTDLFKKAQVGEQSIEKQKLQSRWNKELSKMYASFSDMLDVSAVDIRKEYRNDLGTSISKKVENEENRLRGNQNSNRTIDFMEDKGILDRKDCIFSDLEGRFAIMDFNCKGKHFAASISDVHAFSKNYGKVYLVKINNTFDSFDQMNENSNFKEFKKSFTIYSDNQEKDVYFLFNNPSSSKVKASSILILNYYKKTKDLKLFRFVTKENRDAETESITDKSIDFNSILQKLYNYKESITVNYLRKFVDPLDDTWKSKFSLNDEVDFAHKTPEFYDKSKDTLDKLAKALPNIKKT